MSFYDLNKEQRKKLVGQMTDDIKTDLESHKSSRIQEFFADEDAYIRKAAYLTMGRLFRDNEAIRSQIIEQLDLLLDSDNEKIRQAVINAAGEVGILEFSPITHLIEKGLFDPHHSVRNAVIGSLKKMGEKNPVPVLNFSRRFLHHKDAEVRREICHGLELWGRTHPEDILPLLKELKYEKVRRVKNMVVHVIGQISYKKGCLEKVIGHLKTWNNKELVKRALQEIIDVHERYKNFAFYTPDQAIKYIEDHMDNQQEVLF